MAMHGIIGRILAVRKAASPRSGGPGPHTPEPPPASERTSPVQAEPGGNPHGDLERAARGFVEEHRDLLGRGDPEVLERVFVQGANVFNAINPEAVAAANRAAAAKRALADAIRDPNMPALRFQAIKDEEATASRLNDSLGAAAGELSGFLDRVLARLPGASA